MPHVADNAPERIVYLDPARQIVANERGDPAVPTDVVHALAIRNPDLKAEWLNAAFGQSGFVIKQQWPQGDKRWERVQTGEYNPAQAFDVVAWFPREMRTGEMVSWVEHNMGRVRDPKKEAEKLIAQAEKLMRETTEGAVNQIVETGTERIVRESDHLRNVRAGVEEAHPMVHGADFSEREPKRLMELAKP